MSGTTPSAPAVDGGDRRDDGDGLDRAGRARYRRIMRFALRFLVETWWFELVLPRFGLRGVTERGRSSRLTRFATRFRVLAIELGGLMIKVGQFMSTRLDVLPREITDELKGLQDEVPAVGFDEIRTVVEAELGMPVDRAFARLDPVPLAAASLGQAHRAELSPALAADAGFADVVVKVQRPGIEGVIEVDLVALRRVAAIVSRFRAVARHADVPAIVEEFATTSRLEVDYLHEASNAERFTADFADDPVVRTPAVAWERTTRRVLTLEDVSAVKIDDVGALRAVGIDPAAVADELARVTFEQLFVHGFFHADPHPGNLFVDRRAIGTAAEPATAPVTAAGTDRAADGAASAAPTWDLTFVDFGMMGEIPDEMRDGLREVVIAIVARDGAAFIAGIQRVGVLLPSADTGDLERAMRELFGRFGGMGVAELHDVDRREMADFAERFDETLRSMPMQLPENFLLIVRAISLVSGVCSSLNPAFNMWAAVEPFAGRLVREEGPRTLRGIGERVTAAAGSLVRLPGRLDDLTARIERGDLSVRTPGADRHLRRLQGALERLAAAVVFAGLLFAGALTRPDDVVLGTVLMIASAVPLLVAVFGGRRSG